MIDLYKFCMKCILAGFLISLSCVVYAVSANHYVGSFLFSLGLTSIIIKEYYLYTGKVGNITLSGTPKLIVMFLINIIAAYLFAHLFTYTRLDLSYMTEVAHKKFDDNFISIFILGIGCGVMMHLAYYNFKKYENPVYVIMPIMFFIIAGFDHCIANAAFAGLSNVPLTFTLFLKICTVAVGNGVGSCIFTKLLKS